MSAVGQIVGLVLLVAFIAFVFWCGGEDPDDWTYR